MSCTFLQVFEDHFPDDLRALRDDRISERAEGGASIPSNQSTGNPINHATHRGFRCPPASRGRFLPPFVAAPFGS
jgi:hypothetical protein